MEKYTSKKSHTPKEKVKHLQAAKANQIMGEYTRDLVTIYGGLGLRDV